MFQLREAPLYPSYSKLNIFVTVFTFSDYSWKQYSGYLFRNLPDYNTVVKKYHQNMTVIRDIGKYDLLGKNYKNVTFPQSYRNRTH